MESPFALYGPPGIALVQANMVCPWIESSPQSFLSTSSPAIACCTIFWRVCGLSESRSDRLGEGFAITTSASSSLKAANWLKVLYLSHSALGVSQCLKGTDSSPRGNVNKGSAAVSIAKGVVSSCFSNTSRHLSCYLPIRVSILELWENTGGENAPVVNSMKGGGPKCHDRPRKAISK